MYDSAKGPGESKIVSKLCTESTLEPSNLLTKMVLLRKIDNFFWGHKTNSRMVII